MNVGLTVANSGDISTKAKISTTDNFFVYWVGFYNAGSDAVYIGTYGNLTTSIFMYKIEAGEYFEFPVPKQIDDNAVSIDLNDLAWIGASSGSRCNVSYIKSRN